MQVQPLSPALSPLYLSMETSAKYKARSVVGNFLVGAANQIKEFTQKGKAKHFRTFLTNGFREIESRNLVVSDIRVNPRTYQLMRELLDSEIDPVGSRELIMRGYVAMLWTATVWLDKKIPKYVVTFKGEDPRVYYGDTKTESAPA